MFTKKHLTVLAILQLIALILAPQNVMHFSNIDICTAESGAPPENGTSAVTWIIESNDDINRSHEQISTQGINILAAGKLNWYNMTVKAFGLVNIQNNGVFNITESNITFNNGFNCSGEVNLERVIGSITDTVYLWPSGKLNIINSSISLTSDLIINGKLNLINSTLIMNCSTQGEFYISAEAGGELNCISGSNITAHSSLLSAKVLYIESDSKFLAKDCQFSYIGYSMRFPGIKSEADNTLLNDCTIMHCFIGLTLLNNQGNIVEDCIFNNNTIGINLTNSNLNVINNSDFINNKIGLYTEESDNNKITGSEFFKQSRFGYYAANDSKYNLIEQSSFEQNHGDALSFFNGSSNNTVINSTIRNNLGVGVHTNQDSGDIDLINCALDGNRYHIFFINGSMDNSIINSTLKLSTVTDIYLDNNSEAILLNTSFNKTSVNIGNSSNLTVQWFLHLMTQNRSNAPLPETNITLSDNENGNFRLDTKTDVDGQLKWVKVTEYYQTEHGRVNLTPHDIISEKFGYKTNNTIVIINKSKSVTVTLEEILLFAPDLVPLHLDFSFDYPRKGRNINISATISNNGYADFNNLLTNVTVDFYADSQLINRTFNLSSLKIGAEVKLEFNWTVDLDNGTHPISVLVDPDENLTETDHNNNKRSQPLVVNSIPYPVLNITPDQALTYEDIEFNASSSFNEIPGMEIVEYWFQFGDGENTGWTTKSVVYHNYTNDGVYLVRLRVKDNSGLVSPMIEQNVKINNQYPKANFTITPGSGTVTTEFKFDPSLSYDRDGTLTRYRWEFSDGTDSNLTQPLRRFSDDIEYLIALTVWDDDGAESTRLIKKLVLSNTPPLAVFTVSKMKANVSEMLTFDGSHSSDIDDEFEQLVFIWDFGDGTFGYNDSVVKHNYSESGLYKVSLFVKDDNGNTDIHRLELNITVGSKSGPETDESDILWIIITVVLILVIFILIIFYIFISQSRKLRRLAGAEGEVPEFTTAGKLDFVILKKSFGRRYLKFEVHKTANSPKDYVGIIWKSALLDGSWQVLESVLDSKDKVIDYLEIKVLSYTSKNWLVDYPGNCTILAKEYTTKRGTGVKLSTPIEKNDKKQKRNEQKSTTDRVKEKNVEPEIDDKKPMLPFNK